MGIAGNQIRNPRCSLQLLKAQRQLACAGRSELFLGNRAFFTQITDLLVPEPDIQVNTYSIYVYQIGKV